MKIFTLHIFDKNRLHLFDAKMMIGQFHYFEEAIEKLFKKYPRETTFRGYILDSKGAITDRIKVHRFGKEGFSVL